MKREYLPIDALAAWARLNNVKFHDTEVKRLQTKDGIDKGSAVVVTAKRSAQEFNPEAQAEPELLMTIPPDLVLSLERVETCAKSDRHLKEVLDAVGDYARTARGAILIFLLVHITYSDPDLSKEHIRVSNAWTEYIKFLPASYSLPTFYTVEELELLHGTSLEPALDTKMASLGKEFEHLHEATADIPWCKRDWWSEETGRLRFEDWKLVDAMYRSRALEFPGVGHSMVPCVDMANHASGDQTGALYETDAKGNAVLQLRWSQSLEVGDEVTITYGDEKGASEMIFSYGFLEGDVTNARQLFLDLDIPEDDPLRPAKKAVCDDAPGFCLFFRPGSGNATDWESQFVWWCCVNEEDGLEFRVLQSNEGQRELTVSWKGADLSSSEPLVHLLKQDPMWEVFHLRAIVTLQDRVANQLGQLRASDEYVQRWLEYVDDKVIRRSVWDTAIKLREMEGELLESGFRDLEAKVSRFFPDLVYEFLLSNPSNILPQMKLVRLMNNQNRAFFAHRNSNSWTQSP
ncbi:hypothetical protein AJ79_10292 [Helicocarpus griseus UAMH5409]|uniref:SET domain-containing protein n=1 Tax=Helicocarpus griseus UAMH5409 TaxID=1447875 RepID=A0A2B7WF03_9EURO|nr:hypothetical protein AJ79_10292 [Helicocarpus griseus UAMH5409]